MIVHPTAANGSHLKPWLVDRVVTGNFNVRCDRCGRYCTTLYLVLRSRADSAEVCNVGTDCAWQLAGTVTPTLVAAPAAQEIGDIPDWMC